MTAVISGLGAVCSLGRGVARVWSAMAEGWDGIAPIQRFDASEYGRPLAGVVPDRNAPEYATASGAKLCTELGLAAAREAWAGARLDGIARDRIALVFGTSLGEAGVRVHEITEQVGDALGIAGPRLTISTACASSTNAIGLALDLLNLGAADAVLAGGADVLTPLVLAGFNALGVLSAGKCAPFSEPAGTSLGEGAGFVVLERDTARVRAPFAVLGYGISADAYHDTGPDPSGAGVARGMRSALAHAGVSADDVDYVNAHGTGTRANDPAEWRAIQHVFGRRAETLPVSSSKSFLGHAQGAAGVLETIATLVAMDHGTIPPTQRYTTARPNSPRDPVGQPTARPARCELAVSTSSGFGGANAALVLARDARARRTIARRPIAIAGCGAVGAHGTTLEALLAGRVRGRAAGFRLEDVAPSIDPRGLDPTTQFTTAAVALALADAGVRLRSQDGDRTGLVLGATEISPESDAALQRTIDRHGYRGLSANLFARQVVNAPAGTCARLLGLRGLHSTISAGTATGLVAVVYAAELLATRDDCDRIAVVGVDELPAGASVPAPPKISDAPEVNEGAACAVLVAGTGGPRIAGYGIAGPGHLARAAATALAAAGLDAVELVDLIIGPRPDGVAATRVLDPVALVGASSAFMPAAAVVIGALMIRAGGARHVLLTQTGGGSADCAVVITRGDHHAS